MDRLRVWLMAVFALVEGYLAILPPITQALLWIMLADLVIGVLADMKLRRLSRVVMFEKVTQAVTIIIMIGVAVVLNPHVQPVIGLDLVLSSSYAYLVYLLTSITRNGAILNVPVFSQAQAVLRYFNAVSNPPGQVDSQGSQESKKP